MQIQLSVKALGSIANSKNNKQYKNPLTVCMCACTCVCMYVLGLGGDNLGGRWRAPEYPLYYSHCFYMCLSLHNKRSLPIKK